MFVTTWMIITTLVTFYVIYSTCQVWTVCKYFHMYKNAFIYKIMVCTDGMSIGFCPFLLLAGIAAVCYWLTVYCLWCVSMCILYNYRYICVTVSCTIISLHPSYNIARYGFCSTVGCLSGWPVSLHADTWQCINYFHCVNCSTATVMYWPPYLRWWCVNVNVPTRLMVLCPNNNKVSLVSCLSILIFWLWKFLIMYLLYSHVSFILLPFCMIFSLCFTLMCPVAVLCRSLPLCPFFLFLFY